MNKNHFICLICFQIIFVFSCGRAREVSRLPDRATGPFEERLKDGWRVHAVSFEGEMTNPFDSATQATFQGDADGVEGEFSFEDRNDSAIVDYRIDFYLNLMLGMAPINYLNEGEGIWAFDSSIQTLWFYDFPDTLTFVVDYDADTLQQWHSNVLINDASLGEDINARLDIELRK